MIYYYGIDHPNRLILTSSSINEFLRFNKEYVEKYSTNCYYYFSYLYKNEDIGNFGQWVYFYNKNENYNLENSIFDFKQKMLKDHQEEIIFPIYILKNDIWYICSPETEFLLKFYKNF